MEITETKTESGRPTPVWVPMRVLYVARKLSTMEGWRGEICFGKITGTKFIDAKDVLGSSLGKDIVYGDHDDDDDGDNNNNNNV